MRPRIMYIENKADGLSGPAGIGRVTFSRSGRSVYYAGRTFQRSSIPGFKSNYVDVATGEEYWISGCEKRGSDSLYGTTVEIDDDVREEYWTAIRGMPACRDQRVIRCDGKSRT